MAAIKDALTDIITKLKAMPDATGAPVLQYVSVFNNQKKQLERGEVEAIPLPCCLVEMVKPIHWVMIGSRLKQADVTWKLHLEMEQLDAGDGTMEQNLDVFDQLRDEVITWLTGFRPSGCGSMVAIEDEPDYEHTNLYEFIVSFKCAAIDSKGSPYDPAKPKYTYTTPPLALEVDTTLSHDPGGDGKQIQNKGEYIIPEPQTDPTP